VAGEARPLIAELGSALPDEIGVWGRACPRDKAPRRCYALSYEAPMRVVVFIGILATGCAAVRSAGGANPAGERAALAVQSDPVRESATSRGDGLYPLDEALKDALSGPWEHIGTGPWYGNFSVHACAYRNERVIVVNVYCTRKEPQAFRIDVYSPTRGWVSIYAEAKVPVSTVMRRDYFSFNAAAQPPPRPQAGLPPLALTMSFRELQRYDRRLNERFLPICYGGVAIRRPQGGCLGELAPRAAKWAERNRPFLEQPPDDWYHIIRELRALAGKRGKNLD
jgi:hypothetical protein